MKICIIVPSVAYLDQAGVRIRYRRIEGRLTALGHALTIAVIDDFTARTALDADVYLFSKCYDARAILLAHRIRAAGALTGADFFDDMFSQTGDARFVRLRAWLRDMADVSDFALCSTPRMREVVGTAAPQLPTHILNDPFDGLAVARIARRVVQKREEALAARTIRIAWFGMGDNPSFQVGLADLAAFGDDLRRIERLGFAVDLHILTNRRALTEDGLRMLGRLAVPHRIDIWSEASEADLLDRSLLTFLPVNAQNFSIAKSLNRAVAALSGGTQILSVGHPLYDPLAAFLYRDPAAFVADLEADTLRLTQATLPALEAALATWGNPQVEADRLLSFLQALPPRPAMQAKPLVVLHGANSPATTHKYTQRLGHLSVSSPFNLVKLHYDVRIRADEGETLAVDLSVKAVEQLGSAIIPHLGAPYGDKVYRTLRLRVPTPVLERLRMPPVRSLAETIARYDPAMADVAAVIDFILPGSALILSETSPLLDMASQCRLAERAGEFVVVAPHADAAPVRTHSEVAV